MFSRWKKSLACLTCLAVFTIAQASEVQSHGVLFEKWIRETFFGGYKPSSYSQKWDIPKEANKKYGSVPANPKATKYGTPIGWGDALRQYDIDEPFLLIIGYWQQEGSAKRFVKIVAPTVTPEMHKRLWHPIRREDLEKLDAMIKDRNLDYKEARRLAQEMKKSPPFSEAIIELNPKIDSKTQRRLQCSLRFQDVFKHICPSVDPAPETDPLLFGVPVPIFDESPSRTFQEKK